METSQFEIRIDRNLKAPRVAFMAKREGTEIEFSIREGYILLNEFSAVGGLTFESKKPAARGEGEQEIRMVRKVDHEALFQESKNLIARAYYIMDNHAQQTPIGYYADEEMLEQVMSEIKEIRKAAEDFNKIAEASGSARRVTIDVYPLKLTNTGAINLRIARMVRDRLVEIKAALLSGDKSEYKRTTYRSSFLGKMVSRSYENVIDMALTNAKEAFAELQKELKRGADPKHAGERLHLNEIGDAIKAFDRAIGKLEKWGD